MWLNIGMTHFVWAQSTCKRMPPAKSKWFEAEDMGLLKKEGVEGRGWLLGASK